MPESQRGDWHFRNTHLAFSDTMLSAQYFVQEIEKQNLSAASIFALDAVAQKCQNSLIYDLSRK